MEWNPGRETAHLGEDARRGSKAEVRKSKAVNENAQAIGLAWNYACEREDEGGRDSKLVAHYN